MRKWPGNLIVETDSFARQARVLWNESEIEVWQSYLSLNPLSGLEIPGTGGVRKLRWSLSGMGKRGGARIIYYYYDTSAPIFLLFAYGKASQENLTPAEKSVMKKEATRIKCSIIEKKRGSVSWLKK